MGQDLNTPSEQNFVRRLMKAPLLEADDEAALIAAWQDRRDEKALHKLITAYMKLVVVMAHKFRGYGLDFSDMVQEGSLGLIQAVEKFKAEHNVRFATYARWWVRSAMQDFILRNWSVVRMGSSATQKSLFFNLRWMRQEMERGGVSDAAEIEDRLARAFKVKRRDMAGIMARVTGRDQSLHEPRREDTEETLIDLIMDESGTPEDHVGQAQETYVRMEWLKISLDELSDRERYVVGRRFLEEDRPTLEEIGHQLGVTKERVRQIEHQAFQKLRSSVLDRAEAAQASP